MPHFVPDLDHVVLNVSGQTCKIYKNKNSSLVWKSGAYNAIFRRIGTQSVQRNKLSSKFCSTSSRVKSESFSTNEHTFITKTGVQQTILSWLSRKILDECVPLRSLVPRKIRARWSASRVTPTLTELSGARRQMKLRKKIACQKHRSTM